MDKFEARRQLGLPETGYIYIGWVGYFFPWSLAISSAAVCGMSTGQSSGGKFTGSTSEWLLSKSVRQDLYVAPQSGFQRTSAIVLTGQEVHVNM
jgi:hypothetical protein